MVERRTPLLDEGEEGRTAPRERDSVRVDRPHGLFEDPNAFSWASSLAIGWSALLDRLVPQRRTPPAAPTPTRGEKED